MTRRVVWLSGMPRSGTTWISQLFAASPDIRVKYCPLFSYAFKDCMTPESSGSDWQKFLEAVYSTADPYMDQCHLRDRMLVPEFVDERAAPSCLFIKSNRQHHLTEQILKKVPQVQFIGLVRSPYAAIHSWLSNPNEFPQHLDAIQHWRSGECRKIGPGEFWGFDDWKTVAHLQLRLAREYPDRFLLRRYETMFDNPTTEIPTLFQTLGLDYCSQVDQFLRKSISHHDEHPHSVYKTKSRRVQWQSSLATDIVNAIKSDISGTELEQFADEL